MKNTDTLLHFRTQDQATIFLDEMVGQISDGHWENSRPQDHWKVWCEATVIVDPDQQGRNFYALRTNYNLLSKDLLSVVGERIIVLVKMGRAFGADNARILSEYLFDFTGVGEDRYEKYTYTGPRDYLYEKKPDGSFNMNSPHYDHIRAVITQYKDQVQAIAETDTYTRKDMLTDLREMREAMQTMIPTSIPVPEHSVISEAPFVKPICKLTETDGNVFSLAGKVSSTLRRPDLATKPRNFNPS